MRYLLDSDITIDDEGNLASAEIIVEPLLLDGIAVSVNTYMEVYQGLLRLADPRSVAEQFQHFLEGVAILPVMREVVQRCAGIRADVQRQGRSVRTRALDLLIAATAMELGLTLMTRNVNDYDDVPGLRLLTLHEG